MERKNIIMHIQTIIIIINMNGITDMITIMEAMVIIIADIIIIIIMIINVEGIDLDHIPNNIII